jgi:plasmid stability protein
MGAITIERVNDLLIDFIKAEAAKNGRSIEAEVRFTLIKTYAPRAPQNSVSMIRQMRGADPDEWGYY